MADQERPRPDASFKIKDSLRQMAQRAPVGKTQEAVVMNARIEGHDRFDERGVEAALERFISEHTPEPMVVMALKSHKPEIAGEKIIIVVDNLLQQEKLSAMKNHLSGVLMRILNNGDISLDFKIYDAASSKEVKKLFTAGEKFEHFLKLNPVVADLKTIFGLEVE